MIPVH